MFHFHDPEEGLFLQELLKQCKFYRGKHPEAYALFEAIDSAFCSVTKEFMVETVPVKEELVQYLAVCAKAALHPDPDGLIDFDVDYIFQRALRGLMQTLRWAIIERRNIHINEEDETLFGYFHIPSHFVELWEKERDDKTARRREWRARFPNAHLHSVS